MNRFHSRIAISSFFFLHALCFSSWGARIPAIQEMHSLSEAALGSILLALPFGSLITMPIAPRLVSIFGSRRVLIFSIILYSVFLMVIGFAATIPQLLLALAFFGFAGSLVNVSLNTQAVYLEEIYNKTIMASLHGLWSTAGFVSAAIGALMIAALVTPFKHFVFIFIAVAVIAFICSKFLLPNHVKDPHIAPFSFKLPDKSIMNLGLLAFLSMFCEGTMFDWSGVYFKKIINVEGGWVSAGYVAFMTTMATTRFFADGFKNKYGLTKVLQVSGVFIFFGLLISVIFPNLYVALFGFLLVGSGVSAIVPLVFSQAGKSKVLSSSSAIAAVSTIGFFGFLIGPPLIGWVAGASSLRISFLMVAFIGLSISVLAKKV